MKNESKQNLSVSPQNGEQTSVRVGYTRELITDLQFIVERSSALMRFCANMEAYDPQLSADAVAAFGEAALIATDLVLAGPMQKTITKT